LDLLENFSVLFLYRKRYYCLRDIIIIIIIIVIIIIIIIIIGLLLNYFEHILAYII